jgi:hypothetical protein
MRKTKLGDVRFSATNPLGGIFSAIFAMGMFSFWIWYLWAQSTNFKISAVVLLEAVGIGLVCGAILWVSLRERDTLTVSGSDVCFGMSSGIRSSRRHYPTDELEVCVARCRLYGRWRLAWSGYAAVIMSRDGHSVFAFGMHVDKGQAMEIVQNLPAELRARACDRKVVIVARYGNKP